MRREVNIFMSELCSLELYLLIYERTLGEAAPSNWFCFTSEKASTIK